jgi:hypothetical protein
VQSIATQLGSSGFWVFGFPKGLGRTVSVLRLFIPEEIFQNTNSSQRNIS